MTLESVKKGLESYIAEYSKYPPDGTINTFDDVIVTLKEFVDFAGRTTCEDPVTYTSGGATYRLETTVHWSGGANGGVLLILQDSDLLEAPL